MSPLLVLEKGKRATGVVPRLSPSRDLHPYSIQAFLNAIHLDDLSASRRSGALVGSPLGQSPLGRDWPQVYGTAQDLLFR
jgi:hypothetical protein